jgi:hypothetical protein
MRVDVAFNTPVNLQRYNGPNVEVSVRDRTLTTMRFSTVDHENAVPVARTNITSVERAPGGGALVTGTNWVEQKAPTQEYSVALGSAGSVVHGSSREAYLMYAHVSGVRVYLFDVLDTRQNECALLIVPAPRPSGEAAILTAAEQIKAIDNLEASGILQPAEADRKRAAVTARP